MPLNLRRVASVHEWPAPRPTNYRKMPPPGKVGRNEVVDIFGRWHILSLGRPITWLRRFKAWLGLREPLSIVSARPRHPSVVVHAVGDDGGDPADSVGFGADGPGRLVHQCPKCGATLRQGFNRDGRVPRHNIPRRTSWDRSARNECPTSLTLPQEWDFPLTDWISRQNHG
jgi:hypothetical protein